MGQYLSLLRKGIPEWVFEETRLAKKIAFDFQQKQEEIDRALAIATNLGLYPPEYCLAQSYTYERYRPELYAQLLENMTLEHALVTLASPDFEGLDQQEPIYGSQFAVEDLSKEQREKFVRPYDPATGLALPPANPYFPHQFELKKGEDTKHPVQLVDSEEGRLFYKQDSKFQTPKVLLSYELKLENHATTAR